MNDVGTTAITARLPDPMLAAMDERARRLEAETGAAYTRTDIVRMALAQFLGLVPARQNGSGREQPQQTT